MVYHYTSFPATLGSILFKKILYEALLLALYLFKPSTEAITRILQIVTYMVVEKGMAHKEE